MNSFLLAFIPLFVAIDSFGTIPLFLGLTEGFSIAEKRRLAFQAVITALLVGMTFEVAGHYIFMMIGITAADFRIAGGLLLIIFSIREIFGHTPKLTQGTAPDNFIGIVPLGVPLIAGPALITTLLILHDEYSFYIVMSALVINLLITLGLYVYSDKIAKTMGEATSKVVAKLIAIILTAIGVMMIRKGLEVVLKYN